ncbi:unnamed protein product [Caenorhabditis bovis]|uniref:Integrator complex subunit 4/Protein SIEL C-terminal Ig-like domain-containing protein n=1 Tax=Caenorhabditis bovis TaxID=2654633 RepID=A0A8S1F8U5_9PELO|nr:unnamed protein product [Caenorhabditis bovis]
MRYDVSTPAETKERKLKRRNIGNVLNELANRIENGDRVLVRNILNEIENEYLLTLNQSEIENVCTKLLASCIISKIDSNSIKIFLIITSFLQRATEEQLKKFLLNQLNDSQTIAKLFAKSVLTGRLLNLFGEALDNKIISVKSVPEYAFLSAKTILFQDSIYEVHSRTCALDFFVAYSISDKRDDVRLIDCEKLLCRTVLDRDYRIRLACLKGLTRLSKEGLLLHKSTYFIIKPMLTDTDADIRIMALNLLLHFSNRNPVETTAGKGTLTIPDDAFSAVCDAMNDIDTRVRIEAARLLGEFHVVSDELVFQTLDKKMMRSNKSSEVVKVEKSMFAMTQKGPSGTDKRWRFLKKATNQDQGGGWSRGKELNASCPTKGAEEEDEEDDSIIPHGACGAFVTALEDEFMDVRKAAVYSLGKLASCRPSFAISALEYLADMFNDEIAEVRLDAINALTPLIAHGQLNSEQLNVILKCLDDGMADARQAMRELLKRAQFVDVRCVELCVKALTDCMKRFPKDKEQVFTCMASIGRNHSIHIQSMMRNLLGLNLVFQTREHSLEDEKYLSKLILVLNAASQQSSMIYVFPEFVKRHYRFLRTSSPHLVASIRVLDEEKHGKLRIRSENTGEKAEEIVLQTYNRLCESEESESIVDRNTIRDNIYSDASAISTYNENVSGASRLICCLSEISASIDNLADTIMLGGEPAIVRDLVIQQLADMQSVEYQFSGISSETISYLLHCRLYLLLNDVAVWMMQTMPSLHEITTVVASILETVKKRIKKSITLEATLQEFISVCEQLIQLKAEGEDSKKMITPSGILQIANKYMPRMPKEFPLIQGINLKYAQIVTPHKDVAMESALRFISNMPHGIAFEAKLYNFTNDDLKNLRLKVLFPGGKFNVMKPRDNEIKRDDGCHQLSTHVKVTSSSSWSEAAEIDIVIGFNTECNAFVPVFESPSCFTQSHVRVKIHPVSR